MYNISVMHLYKPIKKLCTWKYNLAMASEQWLCLQLCLKGTQRVF